MFPMVRNPNVEIAQHSSSSSNKFLNERLVSGQKTFCMAADLHFDVLAIQ